MMRWKTSSRTKTPSQPSEIPVGSFFKTEKGYFYVKSKTERYRIITTRLLDSWSPQRVIHTSETNAAVKRMTILAKMKYRNGSLIYSMADGKMYLIENGKRRHITSPDVMVNLNLDRREAITVSLEELNLHEKGLDLK